MSDQQTTTPAPAASDANNPEGTGTQEEPDYKVLYEQEKQRADNLQPEFTRTTQELAQYRQVMEALHSDDPDEQRWAAEALRIHLEQEEAEDDEPIDDLDPRLQQMFDGLRQELTEFRQSQETRAEQEQTERFKQSVVADLAKDDYPEGLRSLVAEVALNQAEQTGQIDIDKAKSLVEEQAVVWAQHPAVQTAVKKGWQKTKPSDAVTQPGGVAATHTPSLVTREQRAAYIAQLSAQAEADD